MKHTRKNSNFILTIILTGIVCLTAISCDMGEDTSINTWEKEHTIDRPTRDTRAVFETTDGRFICISKDTPDLNILCTDENGDELWRQTLSNQDNTYYTVTYSMGEISGGFLVTAALADESVSRITLDSNGAMIQEENVVIAGITDIRGLDATETGWVIAANTSAGIPATYTYKGFSATGEILWDAGSALNEELNGFSAIKATSDGGAIIVGNRYTGTGDDNPGHIIKLDANGQMAWSTDVRAYDILPVVTHDKYRSIYETPDGGCLYTAHYGISEEHYFGSYIAKISSKGNVTTRVLFTDYYANSARPTADKGIILAGFVSSYNLPSIDVIIDGMYIQKLNALYTSQWRREIPSEAPFDRFGAYDVAETADGGFISICGSRHSEPFWLRKVNNKGRLNP